MALSTRARIAGIGGALAIGVLGAGGVAYAAGSGGESRARYVTVIDEDAAPSTGYSREDCPEGADGTAPGTTTPGNTAPDSSSTPGDA